jgi:hypothetical protein
MALIAWVLVTCRGHFSGSLRGAYKNAPGVFILAYISCNTHNRMNGAGAGAGAGSAAGSAAGTRPVTTKFADRRNPKTVKAETKAARRFRARDASVRRFNPAAQSGTGIRVLRGVRVAYDLQTGAPGNPAGPYKDYGRNKDTALHSVPLPLEPYTVHL